MGLANSLFIGVSGLNSFGNALGVVSDNVANANTTGFKASSVTFGDMVAYAIGNNAASAKAQQGQGSMIRDVSQVFSQGSLIPTESNTDLAIAGAGFFVVDSPNDSRYFTRDGRFHFDADGNLVDSDGNFVQGTCYNSQDIDTSSYTDPDDPTNANLGNIQLHINDGYYIDDPGHAGQPQRLQSISIDRNGYIHGYFPDGNHFILAKIGLATFPNSQGLQRDGNNLYIRTSESGDYTVGSGQTNGRGSVYDYTLEQSNVDIGRELTNMIIYQAGFSANAKTISTADEMINTLINMTR